MESSRVWTPVPWISAGSKPWNPEGLDFLVSSKAQNPWSPAGYKSRKSRKGLDRQRPGAPAESRHTSSSESKHLESSIQWPRTFSPGSWRTMPDCPRGAGGSCRHPSIIYSSSIMHGAKQGLPKFIFLYAHVCLCVSVT
jgi:hypothetical protein